MSCSLRIWIIAVYVDPAISHNHPSGNCQPGKEDIELTLELRALLSLVDVVVLDHIVVGGSQTFSMAEHGIFR